MDCLDCKICHLPYDEDGHRPRNAPCGHEICSACMMALIINSIFQCPKCREKYKVDAPDDFPVSFGLIDVIRAFKSINIPLANSTEAIAPEATNDEVCNLHSKPISHWCFKCQIKICDDCIKSHSSTLGCSTATLTKAMESKIENHIKDKDMILTIFEEHSCILSSKLQEHNKLVEEYTKLAKEHSEESKKLGKLLEEGNIYKENFAEAIKNLTIITSPNAVDDGIRMLTQRKQLLQSWSVNNLGIDILIDLPKTLKDKTNVFTDMVIQNVKRHAKLSQHENSIYLHSFLKQEVAESSLCIAFDRVQQMIPFPKEPSLVFLEMSIGGVVKGHVLVCLDKDMPNIREHFVNIVTGQKGPTFKGISFTTNNNNTNNAYIGIVNKSFSELSIIPDTSRCFTIKCGDVLGCFNEGYLSHMFFYLGTTQSLSRVFARSCCVFGNIEDGMSIMQECNHKFSSGVKVSDCGLVINQE